MKSLFQLQKINPYFQFVFLLFFFFIGALIQLASLQGIDLASPKNSTEVFVMMISTQLCLFLLPAFIFIKLIPRAPLSFLHFEKIKKGQDLVWLLILAMGTIVLVSSLATILLKLPLGRLADAMQEERKSVESAALSMNSLEQLPIRLLLMAVLPAIGEEIFFRGLVQRFIHTFTKNAVTAILITAFTFAAFHGSIYNFLPVALGGIILGAVYFYTGNIWYNILLHFLINAIQVVIAFFQGSDTEPNQSILVSLALMLIGMILCIFAFRQLRKNKQALGADWRMPFEA